MKRFLITLGVFWGAVILVNSVFGAKKPEKETVCIVNRSCVVETFDK